MENRLYFNKNRICKRIIRAFKESKEDCLTFQEIENILFEQRTSTGKLFTNNFTTQTISQTLNKYPFFEKIGTKMVKTVVGDKVKVNCWAIIEEEE